MIVAVFVGVVAVAVVSQAPTNIFFQDAAFTCLAVRIPCDLKLYVSAAAGRCPRRTVLLGSSGSKRLQRNSKGPVL